MVSFAYTKCFRSFVLFIRICGSTRILLPILISMQIQILARYCFASRILFVRSVANPDPWSGINIPDPQHWSGGFWLGPWFSSPRPPRPPTRIRILPPNMILIRIFPICIYKATGFVIWSCVTNLLFLQICLYVLGTVSTSPAKAVPRPGTGVRATAPTSVGPQPSSGRLPTPSSKWPGLTHTLQDFCPTLPGKWILV